MKCFTFIAAVTSLICCVYTQGHGEREVAFSVALTQHLNLTHAETVIYDEVITNIGGGYNLGNGVFTCPISGIYVFQFHALTRRSTNLFLKLYHNYSYVVSIWGHTNGAFAAGGNSVILHLTKGDTVSVKSASGYKSILFGKQDEVYCTFSGYMISLVFEEIPVIGK